MFTFAAKSGSATAGLVALGTIVLGSTAQGQTTIPPQNRINQLKSLTDVLQTLPGDDAAADAQQMLATVKSKTVFSESGIQGSTVWAKWKDGPMVAINVVPTVTVRTDIDAPPAQAAPAQAAIASPEAPLEAVADRQAASVEVSATATTDKLDLPTSRQARILATFAEGIKKADKLASVLSNSRLNYNVISRDASLAALRTVSGDGLFYMDAHAGTVIVNGLPMCFVQTGTPVELDSLGKPIVNDDLTALRLVAMCSVEKVIDADGDLIEKKIYTNYGFGPRWVRHYKWHFSKGSLVWINACYAANPALRDAFLNAGASGYLGWTKSVRNMRAIDAGHFLLDRLLGANELSGMSGSFPPETPKQRAFPISMLLPELEKKGLDKDKTPDGDASLIFTRRAENGDFGILAPSIRRMKVDEEHKEIRFTGFFGKDPGTEGRVEIEGTKLKVKSWEPRRITCELPEYGPGSSGLAEVIVREHHSNIVPLTEWNGRVDYELKSLGTLKEVFGWPVRFRHDAHLFRDLPGERPHGDPAYEAKLFWSTKYAKNGTELTGLFTGSGTGTQYDSGSDCGNVMQWNGSKVLRNLAYLPSDSFNPHYTFFGQIDADKKEITMYQLGAGWTKITVYETAPCDGTPTSAEGGAVSYYSLDHPEHKLLAGTGYSFPADTLTGNCPCPYHGNFPPAQYAWKWSTLTASTPPVSPLPDGWAS
jgi:hypothetical protein